MQCLGLTGACAACSHCTATAWELSDLDHSHAATPQRVTRASCDAQLLLLRSDFCAWRRLLLICWKLLIGVVNETGLLLLFAYIALLLLPLSLFIGVRAPSLSHGRLMNSKLLDVAHCSLLHQLFLWSLVVVFWLHWR